MARRKQPKKRGIDLPLLSPRQLDTDEVELVFPESHLHIRLNSITL